MLTPANSAILLVVDLAKPCAGRMRAAASRIDSTIDLECSCFGVFLMVAMRLNDPLSTSAPRVFLGLVRSYLSRSQARAISTASRAGSRFMGFWSSLSPAGFFMVDTATNLLRYLLMAGGAYIVAWKWLGVKLAKHRIQQRAP